MGEILTASTSLVASLAPYRRTSAAPPPTTISVCDSEVSSPDRAWNAARISRRERRFTTGDSMPAIAPVGAIVPGVVPLQPSSFPLRISPLTVNDSGSTIPVVDAKENGHGDIPPPRRSTARHHARPLGPWGGDGVGRP